MGASRKPLARVERAVASGSAVSPSSGGARRAWTIRWSTSSGQSRRTSSWLITRQERKVLSQLQKKKVEEIAKVEAHERERSSTKAIGGAFCDAGWRRLWTRAGPH